MKKAYCKLEGEHFARLVKGEEVIINANGVDVHLILSDIGFMEILKIVDNVIEESMEK